MLYDNHGRVINYVRLAVTDRCNLRCYYCMPESGIQYVNRADLLSYEEMERMLIVMSEMGITKLRITGGEPFVRKGIMEFLERIAALELFNDIHITTNGTFTVPFVRRLENIGIKSINLSLDTLDPERFFAITRRDKFDTVMETMQALLDSTIDVKINMVVMEGKNIADIESMLELTKVNKISVRFIEEMPFNGTPGQGNDEFWSMARIKKHIDSIYPDIEKLKDPDFSTSSNFRIKGYEGSFGIIAAFTRSFCGTCNRIRITPQGDLKTCLYGTPQLSVRDILRSSSDNTTLHNALLASLSQRPKDGFEAERQKTNPSFESMATIGG